jgi:hypothetical protein
MAVKVYRERSPQVLFDDEFQTGPCGWTQLMGGGFSSPYGANAAGGAMGLVSWPSLDGGNSLEFHSEDVAPSTPSADPMVLKRTVRQAPDADGRHMVGFEVWFAYRPLHLDAVTPRAFDFGMDTADAAGARHFGKFRLYTNDASNKWQMASGASPGTYTDIPNSSGLIVGVNENKAGWNKLTFYYDLSNHTYAGLIVNGTPFGTEVGGTALPSTSGVNQFVAEATLAPFANGQNFCVQIRNRTDTNNSKVWAYIARAKGFRA